MQKPTLPNATSSAIQSKASQGKVPYVEVTGGNGMDVSASLFPDCKVTHRAKVPGGSEGVTWLTGAGWFVLCVVFAGTSNCEYDIG